MLPIRSRNISGRGQLSGRTPHHACLVPREWPGHGTRPIGPCHQRPDDKSHPAGKFGQQRPKPFTAPPCAAFVNSRANTTYPVLVSGPAAGQGVSLSRLILSSVRQGASRPLDVAQPCHAGRRTDGLASTVKLWFLPIFPLAQPMASHGRPAPLRSSRKIRPLQNFTVAVHR